ncbi:hypothetical protein ECDEC3A_2984 [Escherichia coli DEC3A]|nr:hypothetical protein ECDEC3A_2984 [Escherichia coli DEC3A]
MALERQLNGGVVFLSSVNNYFRVSWQNTEKIKQVIKY